MLEYRLRVAIAELYECTSEGEGNHMCNQGGFEMGHFKSIEDAKAELEDFFGEATDYGAYEGDNFVSCSRIEEEDGYMDNNGKYMCNYTVVLEKISAVSWDAAA